MKLLVSVLGYAEMYDRVTVWDLELVRHIAVSM